MNEDGNENLKRRGRETEEREVPAAIFRVKEPGVPHRGEANLLRSAPYGIHFSSSSLYIMAMNLRVRSRTGAVNLRGVSAALSLADLRRLIEKEAHVAPANQIRAF